jgi:hypothetical protein
MHLLSPHGLPYLTLPPWSPLKPIPPHPKVHNRLPGLFFGIHDEGTILHNRLIKGFTSNEDKVGIFFSVKVIWTAEENTVLAWLGR